MITASTEQEARRTITLPPGPALLYVTEGDAPTITILDKAVIDQMPSRDRALCRALLAYVTEQFDT
ncbi:hypothetical protein [Microtetraspora niveoalba]|uniref:hypothetical protein n=1 Tax=Microtetraspora niveoalba TaxID=46175 RepID=UPI000833E9EA|nr:hypothetical protein [Microtetraspora niveoalba]